MQQTLFPAVEAVEEVHSKSIPRVKEQYFTKEYCITVILKEEFLWDMRCWDKPKHQYSKEDVMVQLSQWLRDDADGLWTYNCSHCLCCIQTLLDMKWLALEEIADLVLKNTLVKYSDSIGTWNYGFCDEEDCL